MCSKLATPLVSTLLIGCGVISGTPHFASIGFVANAQSAQVAWGERMAFEKRVTGFKVFDANGNALSEPQFDSARPFVDLPFSPVFPDLDIVTGDPISEDAFVTPLTAAESAAYRDRGKIEVSLDNAATVTLEPYGVVVSGQVHALAGVQGSCARFFGFSNDNVVNPFSTLAKLAVPVTDGSWLCHTTFDIGAQDTRDALLTLETVLARYRGEYTDLVGEAGFVVDRNSLSSLDQGGRGSKSMDPTCDQIRKWLDPIGANGYDLIDTPKLLADLHVSTADVTGRDVSVVVIGGGVGPNDDIRCGNVFRGHDTHIADIIQAIAKDADIRAVKVCNAEGNCSSARIVRALLEVMRDAQGHLNQQILVNMSLGGPLHDKPMFAALNLLGQRFGIAAIVSGGNGPSAPAHYPASYSAGVASPPSPSLDNVISVAATGLKLDVDGTGEPGYVIAGFNTRANADVFAPGVNLCLRAALTFRCDVATGTEEEISYPDNLGITGSSFATPVVTGLAALFTEAGQVTPTTLRTCLKDNVLSDPLTGVDFVAFGSGPCP